MRQISTSLRFQGSVIELRNVVQGSTQVKFGSGTVTRSLPCFAQRVLAFLSYLFWIPVKTYCAIDNRKSFMNCSDSVSKRLPPPVQFRFTD